MAIFSWINLSFFCQESAGIIVSIWSRLVPSLEVRLVILILIIGMISLVVWENLRVTIFSRINGSFSCQESTSIVISWRSGLIPCFQVRHVILILIISMISLIVWKNLRVTVFGWINWSFSRQESTRIVVSSWSRLIPSLEVRLVVLILIIGMISLVVWKNLRVTVFSWIDWLSQETIIVSSWSWLIPCLEVRLVILVLIVGVVSLVVWKDLRVAVLGWVDWFEIGVGFTMLVMLSS